MTLRAEQVGKLRAAADQATRIGLPFNRMQSLHWGKAGVPLAGMASATGRYTDLLTKELARHGSRTAYMWTHENGDAQGHHCHLLAHIPPPLVPVVIDKQRGWIRRISRVPYRKGVILSRPIGWLLGLESSNPEVHAVNLAVAVGYLTKQASADAVARFGLERVQIGGRIIGKRYGVSQNIGPKARRGGA